MVTCFNIQTTNILTLKTKRNHQSSGHQQQQPKCRENIYFHYNPCFILDTFLKINPIHTNTLKFHTKL